MLLHLFHHITNNALFDQVKLSRLILSRLTNSIPRYTSIEGSTLFDNERHRRCEDYHQATNATINLRRIILPRLDLAESLRSNWTTLRSR